jgi:septal ring factor EnvC (AmiA/AmiB activator)
MNTQKQIERQIEDINNKICPNEIEQALAFLYAKVMRLEEENGQLKEKLTRLKWTLEEHD